MSWSRKSRAVAVIALLMGMATGVAGAQEETITGTENRAHLDVAATEDLLETAKAITADLFSYDYTAIDAHRARFADLTTGDLHEDYEKLFGPIAEAAVAQKLVVESEAVDAAVRLLRDDYGTVLVFLNQNATRADQNTSTASNAMVLVTFTDVDGRWEASDIDTFEAK